MNKTDLELNLKTLIEHAWDNDVRWEHIENWLKNFNGQYMSENDEKLYALYSLTRFMYFSKPLLMQMLKSLYEEHFKSRIIQRIRRNCQNTKDSQLLNRSFLKELNSTRFVGVGNPAESGAHLLYKFRQINRLPKELFTDIHLAFIPKRDEESNTALRGGRRIYEHKNFDVTRYVFFDDLVGSGEQATLYLKDLLSKIRKDNKSIEFHFISLFATSSGLEKLSQPDFFGDNVCCIFELDSSFKAFSSESRYFNASPSWFDKDKLHQICYKYGSTLKVNLPLGYRNSQLMIGFDHNTPDNTLPIFWDEGLKTPWNPVFIRYDKLYA